MSVEFVKRGLHHVDVFNRRAHIGGAPEEFDFPLWRGLDFHHMAVDLAPLLARAQPVLDLFRATGDSEPDLRRKTRNAPQLAVNAAT